MKLTMSFWKRWLGVGLVVAGLALFSITPALADGHSGHSGHSHHHAATAAPATAVAPPDSVAAPAAAATDSTAIPNRCAVRMAGCEIGGDSAAVACAARMARCEMGKDTTSAGCVSGMMNGCDSASSCPALPAAAVAPETGAALVADSPVTPPEPPSRMGGCGMESSAPTRGHCGHSRPTAAPVAAATYTCPMHPEIVRDAPGSCPKCGMYLVPREE